MAKEPAPAYSGTGKPKTAEDYEAFRYGARVCWAAVTHACRYVCAHGRVQTCTCLCARKRAHAKGSGLVGAVRLRSVQPGSCSRGL